ncbi:MAG: hypothetical protein Q8M54_05635 [Desulfobaccales bacterium]|nr:hypothetical protein [Desulfobaccales bacterium]
MLGVIGMRPDPAQGSIVLTLNQDNREEGMHYVLKQLPLAVEKRRSFSPLWRKKMAAAAGG